MNFGHGIFGDLLTTKSARSARLSSWDHTGRNRDYWMIPEHGSVTLGEIDGPGCITHMWMTSSCRKVRAPGIVDPIANGNTAPVNEVGPALGLLWDEYDPFYYRKALIKMTWDDQDSPSVLTPLGDFFCIGELQQRALQCFLEAGRGRTLRRPLLLLLLFSDALQQEGED